jgi:hypothetical protein
VNLAADARRFSFSVNRASEAFIHISSRWNEAFIPHRQRCYKYGRDR